MSSVVSCPFDCVYRDEYDDDYGDDYGEEVLSEGRGEEEQEDASLGLQVHAGDVHPEAGPVQLPTACTALHAGPFNDLGSSFALCVPTGGRFGK